MVGSNQPLGHIISRQRIIFGLTTSGRHAWHVTQLHVGIHDRVVTHEIDAVEFSALVDATFGSG
ncbi:MAG: hypothetical protein ILNGONEN_01752 [Syntrophorhabdaceae bacterium]|nr:hypothetical protein [Syntrophorhabdaceae bacterium]